MICLLFFNNRIKWPPIKSKSLFLITPYVTVNFQNTFSFFSIFCLFVIHTQLFSEIIHVSVQSLGEPWFQRYNWLAFKFEKQMSCQLYYLATSLISLCIYLNFSWFDQNRHYLWVYFGAYLWIYRGIYIYEYITIYVKFYSQE